MLPGERQNPPHPRLHPGSGSNLNKNYNTGGPVYSYKKHYVPTEVRDKWRHLPWKEKMRLGKEHRQKLEKEHYLEEGWGMPPTEAQKAKNLAMKLAEEAAWIYGGGLLWKHGAVPAWEAGKSAYKAGKSAYKAGDLNPAGIEFLLAKRAAEKGTKLKYPYQTVEEVFENKPSYHGTNDPNRFERQGTPDNPYGIRIPSHKQKDWPTTRQSFSVSSDFDRAKEFALKEGEVLGEGSSRVIPTVLDKDAAKYILDFRNPSHQRHIANLYKTERKKQKEKLFKTDRNVLANEKQHYNRKTEFEKETAKNLKRIYKPEKTRYGNWDILETIIDPIKKRGWKGFTTAEGRTLNLQVLDEKLIKGVRDRDTGEIMYNTPRALKRLDEGGPVREGIMTLPSPVNLRKKQVTVHKPSKSLKKQGFNLETRLKAQYKNTSYIG